MSRNRTLHLLAMVLSVGGLLFVTTSKSHAIDFSTGTIKLSASVTYDGSWKFLIDPKYVDQFKVCVRFDPVRAQFVSALFLNRYQLESTEMLDRSDESNGFIRNIFGRFAGTPSELPLGEVDVVELTFSDLDPTNVLGPNTVRFEVFAEATDFVSVIDPDNIANNKTFIGPSEIEGAEAFAPEPSTLLLGGFALLGFLGYVWRRRRSGAK